jgi:hypothetical protein
MATPSTNVASTFASRIADDVAVMGFVSIATASAGLPIESGSGSPSALAAPEVKRDNASVPVNLSSGEIP